jgi:hypothetical protein
MKKNIIQFKLVLLLTIATQTLFAQSTKFSGNWVLKEKSNLFGTDYANAIPVQINMTQSAMEIVLTRTEIGADENTDGPSSTEKLTLTIGKSTTSKTLDGRKLITFVIAEQETLTEMEVVTLPSDDKVAFNIKEVYSLSDDGKTLTLVKTFENALDTNDKWSTRGIYQKR